MSFWKKDNLLKLSKQSLGDEFNWFHTIQEEAINRFVDRGFPSQKEEAWKYTSTKFIEKVSFGCQKLLPEKIKHKVEFEFTAYHLVFVDGIFIPEVSDLSNLSKKVVVLELKDAFTQYRNDVETAVKNLDHLSATNPFVLLNVGLLSGGLFIKVAKDFEIDKPLHILHIKTAASNQQMYHHACFVCLEENAKAEIFEEFKSESDIFSFENYSMSIQLAKQSSLRHYKLQTEAEQITHFHHLLVTQAEHSNFERCHIDLGSKIARQDLLVQLKEEQTDCQLNGLYIAEDNQHIDNQVRIEHLVSHGRSQQLYKGLADDQAHAIFSGRILVVPNAQKTQAHQVNKNLLLSDKAEIDTKPELEIYADDVQCSHGATIGQLDETALFYLRSRGIKLDDAQDLLKHAFIFEVIETIPSEDLRQHVKNSLIL